MPTARADRIFVWMCLLVFFYAPAGMNAAAMSTYRMLGDVGYMLGPVALGFVADGFGVETALAVAAALLVLVSLAFARFAPETSGGYASIR